MIKKHTKIKKTIAILCTLAMLIGIFPLVAFADWTPPATGPSTLVPYDLCHEVNVTIRVYRGAELVDINGGTTGTPFILVWYRVLSGLQPPLEPTTPNHYRIPAFGISWNILQPGDTVVMRSHFFELVDETANPILWGDYSIIDQRSAIILCPDCDAAPCECERTVTFNLHGGTGNFPPQTVQHGNLVTEPATNPTRQGYTFAGWFTAPTGGAEFDFTAPITGDTVVHARWTPETCCPDYPDCDCNDNGGNGPPVHFPPYVEGPGNGTAPPPPPPNGNLIIPMTEYHYAYLIGFPDGTIRPRNTITRAQVATIFFRLLCDDFRTEMWSQENTFSDVNINDWHNNAISTLANVGLLQGRPDGTFNPNAPITRGEFVALASRFVDSEGIDTSDVEFEDIVGHWAEEYIGVLATLGWMRGDGDGAFRPNDHMTRAEVAAGVNRMLNRLLENEAGMEGATGEIIRWPDNGNVTAWYFLYIQEATNSTEFSRTEAGFVVWEVMLPELDWTVLERPDSTPGAMTAALAAWRR